MQFIAVLSLLAAAAIASPVALPNPDKTFTVTFPFVTTATIVVPETTVTASVGSFVKTLTVPTIPETTLTASVGSFVKTFTVPTLPTGFPIPSLPNPFANAASFPSVSKPTAKAAQ